ncbi:MAG: HAMP domain-containing histidine kinase [Lachnospiraceae bacterium]|nr:HAMP domain-containing histidine kinase [Lachnospiraceae bacterium]
MSLYRDKQIKGFCWFLILFSILLLGVGAFLGVNQINHTKELYLMHSEAVASSLLEQGVSKEVAASALASEEISEGGRNLLESVGMGSQTENRLLPFIAPLQKDTFYSILIASAFLLLVLAAGTTVFLWKRKKLYLQADQVLKNYINGDYSSHLPQNQEGAVYQIFSSVEQLATMLQSKSETEHKTKEFLKDTISDISHQLKTPLAALAMYQEIIESEPQNPETVRKFAVKMGTSLKRMEQLIQSMLKITRLDTGNITFEKQICTVSELIGHSVSELLTRARNENKNIVVNGDDSQILVCDKEWTGEAIGNLVKNALDHMQPGGSIDISWEHTPAMLRVFISDNGDGIAPEDIHHIFKRFYRSKHSLDMQGVGLGLSLAKSIIEGQGGVISVQSELGKGTTFTISFLTEM